MTTKTNGKDDFKIVRKRVSSLKPSPENAHLYRSTSDDWDIPALRASIEKNGLFEPLVISLDNFIISGHRRHSALLLIGQVIVPCRVLPLRRDSMTTDEWVALLREHNRQRCKTVAEQVREELVDINPDEAYQRLRERRDKSVNAAEHNGVAALKIEGTKTRHAISDQKADHVKYIKQVVFEDRLDYWPLSVRGVHYALLNYEFRRNIPRKLPYKNDDESYQAGVTREQISQYNLPPQNFAKESSSNYEWFVQRNGGDDSVYELEALEPEAMLRDLEAVVQSVIDIELFNREVAAEKEEAIYLEAARTNAAQALKGLGK